MLPKQILTMNKKSRQYDTPALRQGSTTHNDFQGLCLETCRVLFLIAFFIFGQVLLYQSETCNKFLWVYCVVISAVFYSVLPPLFCYCIVFMCNAAIDKKMLQENAITREELERGKLFSQVEVTDRMQML